MTERHLGRTEIGMCDRDEGVRVKDLFEVLETASPAVVDQSRGSIAAFLGAQPNWAQTTRDEAITQQGRRQWVEDRAKKLDENSTSRYTRTVKRAKRIGIRRLEMAPEWFRHAKWKYHWYSAHTVMGNGTYHTWTTPEPFIHCCPAHISPYGVGTSKQCST